MLISIRLAPSALKAMRTAIRKEFPGLKSSAVAESLAYGLGYNSNAALQTSMRDFPDYAIFITQDFVFRLRELLGDDDPTVVVLRSGGGGALREALERILKSEGQDICRSVENTVSTFQAAMTSHYGVESGFGNKHPIGEYPAWVKIMTSIVNRMLNDQVFSTLPGDNRWEANAPHGGYERVIDVAGKPTRISLAPTGKDIFIVAQLYSDTGSLERALAGDQAISDMQVSGTFLRSVGVGLDTSSGFIGGVPDALSEFSDAPCERPCGFASEPGSRWHLRHAIQGDLSFEKTLYPDGGIKAFQALQRIDAKIRRSAQHPQSR